MIFNHNSERKETKDLVLLPSGHRDVKFINRFTATLVPLAQRNNIRVWHDGEIELGTKMYEQICKAINNADAVIVLVTPELFNDDFIMEHALPLLFSRFKAGECCLLPLYLRYSNPDKISIKIDKEEWFLTRLKGLNEPDHPFISLNPRQQDKSLADMSINIIERV